MKRNLLFFSLTCTLPFICSAAILAEVKNRNVYPIASKNPSYDFKLLYDEFYRSGYTYEESLRLENQILDFIGVSLKQGKVKFSFPESRIDFDGRRFWSTYQKLLRNQLAESPKLTNDISNGFDSSLYSY